MAPKDQICSGCKTKGAVPKHCGRCERREKQSKAKAVRTPRNFGAKVSFDDRQTPNMENVQFRALGEARPGSWQTHSAFPDTGAEQSMISEDLLETLGLDMEPASKAMEAVHGGRVSCLGSCPVEVKYQGRTAQTRLLVTSALKNEVILSKTVLEKLEVIDPDFPNVKARGIGKGSDPKGPELSLIHI